MASWMEQQAAEYADLVGSFVESVVDSDTDEMIEYQLIWEGGDLGVALTTLETENTGVQVSRVTGKGFPFGIKNVGPGDILLSINMVDTTKLTLDQVVGFLQECDLPATLRFKKVSPDMDKVVPRPSVPRHSQFVVTTDGPTSPTGSAPPYATGRSSHKVVPPPPQQQRQSSTHGRASVQSRPSSQSSQGRPSTPNEHAAGLPSPPPPVKQQQQTQVPPAAASIPSKHESKPVAVAAAAIPVPVSVTVTPPPQVAAEAKPSSPVETKAPAAAAPPAVSVVAVKPTPTKPPAAAKPAPVVAAAAVAAVPTAASASPVSNRASEAPKLTKALSQQVEEIMMLGAASNDLGFDEDSDSDASDVVATTTATTTPKSEPAMRASDDDAVEDDDDAFVVVSDDVLPLDANTFAADESVLPTTRQKSSSSVAMLGHYSIATDTVPILPDTADATGIASVDNVHEYVDDALHASSDDDSASPNGHAVRPSDMRSTDGHLVLPGSPVKPGDLLPRESIRMTLDSQEPTMMKSQPIGTLHELCAKGNVRGVAQLVRVNGPDELATREPNHGQTGLHLAVKSGNVQLVKFVLEAFKPLEDLVNCEDDKGNTPLHFAATKTPAMVHALLESGASANVKNSRKLTPLIIAVITSRDDSVIVPRMLLKYGANPNDMHESHTVIHTAISSGRLQIAGALVKAGAKMDVEDADGKNVFEKLDRRATKLLLAHIYFPPTYITEKERQACMLCHKKLTFRHRKVNCTHCGRLCCADCCALTVEMVAFPMGFPGRTRRGAAVHDPKRVCKTCYAVFKERTEDLHKPAESTFMARTFGVEWDEVNPNKLAKSRGAGRRGEKD